MAAVYKFLYNSAQSRSSIQSEDIREKWRKVEIKKLWQFPPRRRTSSTPVQEKCFIEVGIQMDSDDDETTESDDESTTSSESFNKAGTRNIRRGRKNSDPKFERRTYLNSIAFSSDFCSEFMQIGSQMGLNSDSLQKAIVVGTTVKCAVAYPSGLDGSLLGKAKTDFFNFLYTFTPSIQSKCLPQKPLTWWKRKMLSQAEKQDEDRWPQPHLVSSLYYEIITNIK